MNNENQKLNKQDLFDLVLFTLKTQKMKGTLDPTIDSVENITDTRGQRVLEFQLNAKEFTFRMPEERLFQYYEEANCDLIVLLNSLMQAIKEQISEFEEINPMNVISNLNVDNFYIQVMPWQGNEDYLEGKIHYPVPVDSSLRAVVRYFINSTEDDVMSFVVSQEIYNTLRPSVQQSLYELAKANTLRLFPLETEKMVDSLITTLKLRGMNQYQINQHLSSIDEHSFLYRISTRQNLYGSNALLFTGEIAKIAKRLGTSVYVLPASRAEIFVVSTRSKMNAKQWLDTISDANQEFDQSEWLSDNLYIYTLDTNTIQIVDNNHIK